MRILIDNCVPRKFPQLLISHDIVYARKAGWQELSNGSLITAADAAGFDVLLTTDKNLQYQQNIRDRRISIIILSPLFVYYEELVPLLDQLEQALEDLPVGSFLVIKPKT